MRLRKPCEHGRYETHWSDKFPVSARCPGGEFLADDALVFEPENCQTCSGTGSVLARNPYAPQFVDGTHLDQCPRCRNGKVYPRLEAILDALTVREGAE